MFRWSVRFQVLICVFICLCLTACIPNPTNAVMPSVRPTPASGGPKLEIKWTYRDARRFALELLVTHYPLPQGFQTICPLTQLRIINGNTRKILLLYQNPEQINLDDFYAITQHSRWYCKKQAESNGFADYLFSLTYYYDDDTNINWDYNYSLSVELGAVIATNSLSAITLPEIGTFGFPLAVKAGGKNLTWLPSVNLTSKGILVEINRVAVNPSFTLLDACLEYQDHHFWRPIAAILYQGREEFSTELLPTFPSYPTNRASILQSTRRCYSLIIPFAFRVDSSTPFQIGINQVQIINSDPEVVTLQECDAVKNRLENAYSGLKIRCYEFETHGQVQHWFEIISRPSETSTQEAYDLVESAFTQVITGPWYIEIQ